MGLNIYKGAVWAVSLASTISVIAQPNPPDSDGDTVPDHTDLCPQTAGSPNNSGCPIDEEVVVVYGVRDNYSSVECPDGSTVSYYTDCSGFESWDSYWLAEHDESTGEYSGTTTRIEAEEETVEGEDASADEEEFADIDCDDGLTRVGRWEIGRPSVPPNSTITSSPNTNVIWFYSVGLTISRTT